jgi:hypothetical protein
MDFKTNMMTHLLSLVKHPKFKWVIITILLCISAFVYFKTQKKKVVKKDNKNVELKLNKNNKPEIVEKNNNIKFEFKDKEFQKKIEQLDNQQQAYLNQMHQHHNHAGVSAPALQPLHKVPIHAPQEQQQEQNNEDTESSDEVFIENENIMNHNLTMEEMNAIDKQLEDILE